MSAPVTLIRLRPDVNALAKEAARAGFTPNGGDLGYALHAGLTALFGPELAPKPFALKDGAVLGYSPALPEEIQAAASLPLAGGTGLAAALQPHTLETRAMPTLWRAGQALDIEVRLRPVVRTRLGRGRERGGRERDLFFTAYPDPPDPAAPGAARKTLSKREAAYGDWLAAALRRDGAAVLHASRMTAYARTKVLTRPETGQGRTHAAPEGPDATFLARIEIGAPEAFAKLLARGIGRHRAFGFGMLLLAPPGRLLKG